MDEKKRKANQDYYKRNKRRLNKKAAKHYAQNKRKIALQRWHNTYLASLGIESDLMAKKKVAILNGKEVRVFTPAEFCNRIGRPTGTVRVWEMRGVVPPPLLRRDDEGSWRIYTEGEVMLYAEALETAFRNNKLLQEIIWAGYEKLRKEYGLDQEEAE